MPDLSLDTLDRSLIAALRQDGRAPVAKLAQILGVSRGTVQSRLDRLIARGVVLGFSVKLRGDQDDDFIHAISLIEVSGRTTAQVVSRLKSMPEIEGLHSTSGKWDLVVSIRVETLREFDRVLADIRRIDGVRHSETSLLLSRLS